MTDTERKNISEAIESIHTCLTLHARDHSLDKRDAWVYGIVIGWEVRCQKSRRGIAGMRRPLRACYA